MQAPVRDRFPHVHDMSNADYAVLWRNLNRGVMDDLSPLVIRYEDVIPDLPATVSKCLEYLNLPMVPEIEAAILNSHETFETHGTAESPAASIGRWQLELDAKDVREIEDLCGETMPRFGYSK